MDADLCLLTSEGRAALQSKLASLTLKLREGCRLTEREAIEREVETIATLLASDHSPNRAGA